MCAMERGMKKDARRKSEEEEKSCVSPYNWVAIRISKSVSKERERERAGRATL